MEWSTHEEGEPVGGAESGKPGLIRTSVSSLEQNEKRGIPEHGSPGTGVQRASGSPRRHTRRAARLTVFTFCSLSTLRRRPRLPLDSSPARAALLPQGRGHLLPASLRKEPGSSRLWRDSQGVPQDGHFLATRCLPQVGRTPGLSRSLIPAGSRSSGREGTRTDRREVRKPSGGEPGHGGGASERLPPAGGLRRQVKSCAGGRGLKAWESAPYGP